MENGIGAEDQLVTLENGEKTVLDDYRIDYLRQHLIQVREAICDGVEIMGVADIDICDCFDSSFRCPAVLPDGYYSDLREVNSLHSKVFASRKFTKGVAAARQRRGSVASPVPPSPAVCHAVTVEG